MSPPFWPEGSGVVECLSFASLERGESNSVKGQPNERTPVVPTLRIRQVIERLLDAGTSNYGSETRRRLAITNLTGYLAALTSLTYATTYLVYNSAELKWVVLVNVVSALIAATIPFWHRFNSIAAVAILVSSVYSALLFYISVLGRDSGIQLNYVSASAVAFVVLGLKRPLLILVMIGAGLVMTIVAHLSFAVGSSQPQLDDWFINGLFVQSVCSCMLIIGVVVWYSFRVAADAEERSERLLRNILPNEIAERLKSQPNLLIADRFDDVSVLFADLVGFTPLSKSMQPDELVKLLNEIFTCFDEQAANLTIEKIKTIGDAYMAVCGIPAPIKNHQHRIIKLAVGMHAAIAEISDRRKIPLGIRIGIASGSITAGVIGKAKFAYDVWAPTVNLAARLESHGEVGRVHVSEEIKLALENDFEFELASPREIKGIGRIRTWFLGPLPS